MNPIMIISKTHWQQINIIIHKYCQLMYEIETKNIYDDFSNNREMFDFSNYSATSKYYDDSNALVVGEMKDEMGSVVIEEFVGLKPKMYLILASNSSEYKKANDVNKNIVAKISHNEYKDVLLNKKYLRHSMNRIQSKNHRIGTYEIDKICLSCFDDNFYILDNGIGMCYGNGMR